MQRGKRTPTGAGRRTYCAETSRTVRATGLDRVRRRWTRQTHRPPPIKLVARQYRPSVRTGTDGPGEPDGYRVAENVLRIVNDWPPCNRFRFLLLSRKIWSGNRIEILLSISVFGLQPIACRPITGNASGSKRVRNDKTRPSFRVNHNHVQRTSIGSNRRDRAYDVIVVPATTIKAHQQIHVRSVNISPKPNFRRNLPVTGWLFTITTNGQLWCIKQVRSHMTIMILGVARRYIKLFMSLKIFYENNNLCF